MPTLTVPLVGMHFSSPAKQVLAILPAGAPLQLQAEPDNPYDPEAILVLIDLDEPMAALRTLPEIREAFEESLVGTGFDLEELTGPMKMGHVGATGRGPCLKLGLGGTREVHALALAEGGMEALRATLGFTPDGSPVLHIEPGEVV